MAEQDPAAQPADAKREAADRAVAVLEDLVAVTLRGGERGRFAQVQRLAVIGQQLEAAVGTRVDDFPEAAEAMGVDGFIAPGVGRNLVAPVAVGRIPIAHGVPPDDDRMGLIRQALLLVGPYVQAVTEGQRAQGRAEDARELAALGEALDRAEARVAEARGDDDQRQQDRRERDALRKLREQVVARLEARVDEVEREQQDGGQRAGEG